MSSFEVPQPILNSPYEEPAEHWQIAEGEEPRRLPGRRPAMYYYRPSSSGDASSDAEADIAIEMPWVNRIRERLRTWRDEGWPGVTRTTRDLLQYWRRDGRKHRLFFAQLEAAETLIFLVEGRADLRHGISIPFDEPSEERKSEGVRAFRRYACKMATGSGKTTVMGMLAAWSILNKVNDRADGRFSDAILVVCPNVTIRSRLAELSPSLGEASLYRTRDLVPGDAMPRLAQGRVFVVNWHVFEPQSAHVGETRARVIKAGVRLVSRETVRIGDRTTTAHGKRYLSLADFERQKANGLIRVLKTTLGKDGATREAEVESDRWVESDAGVVRRVLDREICRKRNLLVFNDEAHHAYRIGRAESDESGDEDDAEEDEYFERESSVWIEGLDRIHKVRGINFCVDLSATPFFLKAAGRETNRPFPWVVSEFGLTDAIESGLVKIPQIAIRDTSGAEIPGYSNIWRWVLERLSPAEKGGRKAIAKPEAVLKYAHTPIAMLGSDWEELRMQWAHGREDQRPPVFILVCKNTRLAKVLFGWLASDECPAGIPPIGLPGFRNEPGRISTIRVDSKVVRETDTGEAKNDETAWMRLTLDTVGRLSWPRDAQEREVFPEGFEALAKKLERPLYPPGRDVRAIVSVGMLTEGWDCNTVTHIVGLRPFQSQLLCEQVVGRALRRVSYDVGADGRLSEEVARIFGVPFSVVPFKANPPGTAPPKEKRYHVHPLPSREHLEIRFPRVEGYRQAVRNRVTVDWSRVRSLTLDPLHIPPEVEMKALLPRNRDGRPSFTGPGAIDRLDLNPYRSRRRLQELVFDLATALTRDYVAEPDCEIPAHVLFPQLLPIVRHYLNERVVPHQPTSILDVFFSPYWGWTIEELRLALRPDTSAGEAPELPRYEAHRPAGSTREVDFWTSRDVREVERSHLNYVVADTKQWEQSAAYAIDTDPRVEAFAKNAGLGFAIPYLHDGRTHDYVPDFIIRLKGDGGMHLVLEVKGYDPLRDVKVQAAQRWVAAVNADGSHGRWAFAIANDPLQVRQLLQVAGTPPPR